MSKPIIEVKSLSKVYNISHEKGVAPGTATLRDNIVGVLRKPVELITGHKLQKEKFWALDDVSFKIEQGEALGIIGRNGSGKSTMLKVLSRIVEPTRGQAILRGHVASLLEVGTGFHPELTGRENIFFNGAILGMPRREITAKFDEIVAFSEIEQFLDTPVKFYSSGMYVRLAFAVAAHLDPDILIVDEVLAVGDAAFQEKCLGKMKDVASNGRTVIFVSHSMPSVKALCTKALWLDKGKVKEIGDIEKVADSYSASSVSSEVDLAKRPRVTAVTGEAKIVNIQVTTLGDKGGLIDSKKPMEIEFEIDSTQALEGVILHCVIAAGGALGHPVLRLMSEYTNTKFDLKKGRNKITCLVDPTALTEGVYSLSCSILYLGREAMGHIDELYDASTFAVRDYKVEKSDIYLTQREAAFYAPHSWTQK